LSFLAKKIQIVVSPTGRVTTHIKELQLISNMKKKKTLSAIGPGRFMLWFVMLVENSLINKVTEKKSLINLLMIFLSEMMIWACCYLKDTWVSNSITISIFKILKLTWIVNSSIPINHPSPKIYSTVITDIYRIEKKYSKIRKFI
jgi:hypothetical protein